MNENLIREMETTPEIDVEKRILRNCRIATCGIAEDGWIILPRGIETADYLRGREVMARHGKAQSAKSNVIARCNEIRVTDTEVFTETQFADTELGRDYAWLYGCNPEKQIFMRRWSINVDVLAKRTLTRQEARVMAGQFWHADIAERILDRGSIQCAEKSLMREYSAVELGADRDALTRAASSGIRTAGQICLEMDLMAAREKIAVLEREEQSDRQRLEKLEHEIKALRGKEDSAAATRNAESIVRELDAMLEALKTR